MNYYPQYEPKLKTIKDTNPNIIFSRDKTTIGAKEYVVPPSYEDFITFAESLKPEKLRNFYEHIIPEKKIKLFFDIDICPAVDETLKNTIVHSLIEKTIKLLNDDYNITDVNERDFAVIDSSGMVTKHNDSVAKTSFHVVLTDKACFTDIKVLRDFIKKGFENNKDNTSTILGLDLGVYKANGCLRIPNSTKMGQERYLKIQTDQHSIYDCLITYINKPTFKELGMLKKKKISKEDRLHNRICDTAETLYTHDKFLLDCINALDPKLADDYDTWINVGIKFFTAGGTEDIWHEFSMKSSRYNKKETHMKWLSFNEYPRGISTPFLNLVRQYDPEIVNKLHKNTIANMGDFYNEIASTLATIYGEDFVFSNGEWYYYNGVSWQIDTDKIFLSKKIITDFHLRLDREIIKFKKDANIPETDDHPNHDIRTRLINVKEKTQGGRIVGDWHILNTLFYKPNFSSLLNTTHHLIGFNNGVYDLQENVFREGYRDDYIAMSVGYNYLHPEEIEEYSSLEESLNTLLSEIFPDSSIMDYVLTFISSCLSGSVCEELIHFFTGTSSTQTGANGKSTFISLILHTLGEYGTCGHSSIITSKRENPQNANSAIMSLKDKRFVSFQEIETGDNNYLNMNVLKNMTGNDSISGRQLYKNQEVFIPQWKLVVCSNSLPPVSSDDGGTRRRIRNIPFESKFVDNPKDKKWKDMEHVYKIDYTLKTVLKHYSIVFMHKLIHYYCTKYKKYGLPRIEKIELHTDSYFNSTSIFRDFIDDCIEKTEDGFLTREELNMTRLSQKYPELKKLRKTDFFEQFENFTQITCVKYHKNESDNKTYKNVYLGYKLVFCSSDNSL